MFQISEVFYCSIHCEIMGKIQKKDRFKVFFSWRILYHSSKKSVNCSHHVIKIQYYPFFLYSFLCCSQMTWKVHAMRCHSESRRYVLICWNFSYLEWQFSFINYEQCNFDKLCWISNSISSISAQCMGFLKTYMKVDSYVERE